MLIKSIAITKDQLTTVSEDTTLEEALKILEESGFRCIPILDASQSIFRGNIYKMHIYKHKSEGGDMTLPVTHLLKNATKSISINASFFKVFFSIKELPYIAILDENKHFYGILTHGTLLNILEQGWNVKEGRYVLTVESTSERGELARITKIIARYSNILNCITLDNNYDDIRRTIITLPADTSQEVLNKIVRHLERKHFNVLEIEDLHSTI